MPIDKHQIPRGLMGQDIERDRECGFCGYNLRGLKKDGRCPECGRAIRSFDPSSSGNLLSSLSVRELRLLATGSAMVAFAILFLALGMVWWPRLLKRFSLFTEPAVWVGLGLVATSIVMATGVWLMTRPGIVAEPARLDGAERVRLLTRWLAWAWPPAVLTALAERVTPEWGLWLGGLACVLGLMAAVGTFTFVEHLRRFTQDSGDPHEETRLLTVLWILSPGVAFHVVAARAEALGYAPSVIWTGRLLSMLLMGMMVTWLIAAIAGLSESARWAIRGIEQRAARAERSRPRSGPG
jgi:hypothetical protein